MVFFGRKKQRQSRSCDHASLPSKLTLHNKTRFNVSIGLDGMDPILVVPSNTLGSKELPPTQLGLPGMNTYDTKWSASLLLSLPGGGGAHHVCVASGKLSSRLSGGQVSAYVELTPRDLLLPDLRALRQIVRAQRVWRHRYALVKELRRRQAKAMNALKAATDCMRRPLPAYSSAKQQQAQSMLLYPTEEAEALGRTLQQLDTAAQTCQRTARRRLARKRSTCSICFDEMPWCSMVSLVPETLCHPRICRGCATQYVNTALTDGKLYVRCPAGDGCKTLISNQMLHRIASPEVWEAHQMHRYNNHADRLNTLDADDKAFVAWLKKEARRCPICNVIIYRYEGCNHMSCRCGASFNWDDEKARIVVG